MHKALEFYSSQSKFSNPGRYAHLYQNLPTDIPALCNIAHNLIIDFAFCKLYGVDLSNERIQDVQSRYVEVILEKAQQLDASPITQIREPKNRVAGSCRDFAIVLCSMLRYQNIPARLRCGFETYFNTGKHEDHWVVEYWNQKEERWILTDPEIGEIEKEKEGVTVDPYNIPRDKYLIAAEAWQKCRSGEVDPMNFGVSTINVFGPWFVRANVLRDFAALNKFELLPWEYTKFADKEFKKLTDLDEKELEIIDLLAKLTNPGDNTQFDSIRNLYNSNSQLQVVGEITSYTPLGPKKLTF